MAMKKSKQILWLAALFLVAAAVCALLAMSVADPEHLLRV